MRISELIRQLQFVLDNCDDADVCVAVAEEDSPYANLSEHSTPLRVDWDGFFNGPDGAFARYATVHVQRWDDVRSADE